MTLISIVVVLGQCRINTALRSQCPRHVCFSWNADTASEPTVGGKLGFGTSGSWQPGVLMAQAIKSETTPNLIPELPLFQRNPKNTCLNLPELFHLPKLKPICCRFSLFQGAFFHRSLQIDPGPPPKPRHCHGTCSNFCSRASAAAVDVWGALVRGELDWSHSGRDTRLGELDC